ncbi:MAG: exodeoxyribonuclease III [Rickettsiaceae bacterium H1]|nr:exodeoxyribonuclease III [Rickettsiaceae bacterium H1]
MLIATWNVNSIRQRLDKLIEWLKQDKIDIVLLQEIKCTNEQFPYREIEDSGYNVSVNGQKSYNGVAILTKFPIQDVITVLPGGEKDDQARYIEGVISLPDRVVRVASIYVPNGQEPSLPAFKYKMNFFDRLYERFALLLDYEEIMVLGGDYNVAPESIDVYDSIKLDGKVGFHPDERAKFRKLCNLGLYDSFRIANSEKTEFSWWDYRSKGWKYNRGMRIDNMLLSPQAVDKLDSCEILTDMRGEEKPSDHVPVVVTLAK